MLAQISRADDAIAASQVLAFHLPPRGFFRAVRARGRGDKGAFFLATTLLS